MPLLLETQLSADAAFQTIGQRVAKPLGQIDTAPRWRSVTWPRTRGLNAMNRRGLAAHGSILKSSR
jgi:hypothetical protein